MCIPLDKVCDGANDCGQWEDEPKGKCNVNECAVNNGGCLHICIDTVSGFRCGCRPGYALAGNSTCIGKKNTKIEIMETKKKYITICSLLTQTWTSVLKLERALRRASTKKAASSASACRATRGTRTTGRAARLMRGTLLCFSPTGRISVASHSTVAI